MNYRQNLHIHTVYGDGHDTPEEMILAAVEQGFDSIGFSEHSYNPYSPGRQMTPEATERYKREIRRLKEQYSGKIDIFCGMEYEFQSDLPTEEFDYLIGSVHYLEVDGGVYGFDRGLEATLAYVKEHFGGDGMRFAKAYYETVARLPEKKSFDIIGHFDLLTKNNERGCFLDTSSKAYLDCGMEAIYALKGKIPLFEVNTGAISRGYRTAPYPQMEFLKEFCRCGFGVVLTSDCHNRAHIDCFYEEAESMIREAGFRTQWILTDTGFREMELL